MIDSIRDGFRKDVFFVVVFHGYPPVSDIKDENVSG